MEVRQLNYFIKVGEAVSRSGLDRSILGAMYIGTIHAYCKFLLGEMDARYRFKRSYCERGNTIISHTAVGRLCVEGRPL